MRNKILSLIGACLALLGSANAAEWPDKPIKIIVPAAPGGAADTLARLIGKEISDKLGQPVVIDNRAGAAAIVGTQALARSPNDGYTIGMVFTGAMAINPAMYKPLPYDPVKDFDPIAMISASPLVLVASQKSDIKSLGDLVQKAKNEPGKYSYGSAGIGSTQRLSMELLKASYNIDMLHVPYKGSSPALIDLQAGLITTLSDNAITLIPLIQAGQVTPLAVESPRRLSSLPDVPTTTELGFPKFQASGWYGMVAPAGAPSIAIKKLHAVIDGFLRSPAFNQTLSQQGMEPQPGSVNDFKAFLAAERIKWASAVEAAKIPPQELR
ncbi:tripartite tricarboxylate transporter substrate binding protein [Paucibacter sp. O1-1]|nr:tripartite tricarboxylate transporter substrate binding protein [Paucibacter sp. O1-1]MDA3825058.1 tripartite tricarboxylate transporter substrate binding protein [Paucibacter sp. O1-1]